MNNYVKNTTCFRRDLLLSDMDQYTHCDSGSKCLCCDVCKINLIVHVACVMLRYKGAIKNLGSGKTEKAIVRVCRAISTLSPILS